MFGNVTLLDSDVVSVYELEYLRNASLVLGDTTSRTLQNYMVWRFMMSRAANMPQSIRILRDRFDRVFRGTSAEQPRTILCGNFVNNNMGFAVSKLYIKQYFDENARNQVSVGCSVGPVARSLLFSLVTRDDQQHPWCIHRHARWLDLDGCGIEEQSGWEGHQHRIEIEYVHTHASFRHEPSIRRSAIPTIWEVTTTPS